MSKTVKSVTKPVHLCSGEVVVLASDGTIRRCCGSDKVGTDMSECDTAVTQDGLRAIRKAIPLITEAGQLTKKLEAIKGKLENMGGHRSDNGELRFIGDDGGEDDHSNVGIGVGCTFVEADELPAVLKALGIK